jgi:hypothetical protein
LTEAINTLKEFIKDPKYFSAKAIGSLIHSMIVKDVREKFVNSLVRGPWVYIKGAGFADLVIGPLGNLNVGELYEIKPRGGSVDPSDQLKRYLKNSNFSIGTTPFAGCINDQPLELLNVNYETNGQGRVEYWLTLNQRGTESLVTSAMQATATVAVIYAAYKMAELMASLILCF